MGENSLMATRTVNSVRNPEWADAAHSMIDLEVDFDELDEVYVPFTASQNDPEEWGRTLFQNAVDGQYGEIAEWVTPANLVGEDALDLVRPQRDERLKETDYIEMPTKWATLTSEKQAEWTTYRQALRDLPSTYPNVEYRWSLADNGYVMYNLIWPTKPEN